MRQRKERDEKKGEECWQRGRERERKRERERDGGIE